MEYYHYILLILILGTYFLIGIFPKNSSKDSLFLISGRKLSSWDNGFSIAASKIGGGLLVTYSTLFFAFGYSALWLFGGFVIGYILFYLFVIKTKIYQLSKPTSDENTTDNDGFYTLAHYFKTRFGFNLGFLMGGLTTLSSFGWILTNLVAGSYLIHTLTDISYFFVLSIIALIIGAYLFVGGFHSVIRTDKIQFGSLLVIATIFGLVLVTNELDTESWIALLDTELSDMPIGQVVGFVILGILFPFGSAELWQRVYASQDEETLKKSLIISSSAYVILGIILSVICSIILFSIPDVIRDLDKEVKLYYGLAALVPKFLLPFWLIAYISALISSADTFIYTTASSIVQDILYKKTDSKYQTVKQIRLWIVILIVLSVIIGMLFKNVVSITFIFVGFTLIIAGITVVTIPMFNKRKTIKSLKTIAIIGGVLGFLGVLTHIVLVKGDVSVITALIGFVIVVVVYLLVSIILFLQPKK